jgi:hypothetical protein
MNDSGKESTGIITGYHHNGFWIAKHKKQQLYFNAKLGRDE